jgi:predicted metal-dependent hydrolase
LEEVRLLGGRIHIHTQHPRDAAHVRGLLSGWYRSHAMVRFERAVDKAMPLFKKHHIKRPIVRAQHMRKRWGSCTPKGTILLNPELIQAPGACIDYVVVHELCHLVYPDHGADFTKLLARVLPNWKKWKARLEESMA